MTARQSAENDAPDWHDASDHPTVESLLACPIRHREFRDIPPVVGQS